MKKISLQLIGLVLLVAVLAGLALATPDPDAPVDEGTVAPENESLYADYIVRVGLFYGSGTMDGANLKNSTDSDGFEFGYYDDENNFFSLAKTDRNQISVVKTTNVYYGTYGGYTSYHEALSGASVGVGCYHLELPGVYETYEEASAVASQYDDGFVAYIGGSFYARIGNYLGSSSANSAKSKLASAGVETSIKGTSEFGVSVVATGTKEILFQFDDEGKGTGMTAIPIPVEEGCECETTLKGTDYYGGFRFERIKGGDLTIVNMVPIESYTKSVVSREISYTWPEESLKALAVSARTYAIYNEGRHKSYHFDVCGSTHCQAYAGNARMGEEISLAVEATAGEVMTYDGKIISVAYYASNGGASESSSTVWGGKQELFPYLVGVTDPYEAYVANKISGYNWSKTFSGSQLDSLLSVRGYGCSTIVSVSISSYSASGNPKTVTFTDSNGYRWTLTTPAVVSMLGFQSYNYGLSRTEKADLGINGEGPMGSWSGIFTLNDKGEINSLGNSIYIVNGEGETVPVGTGSASGTYFTFVGSGWGHNVGLSQWGTYAMAEQGFTYDEILKFYFTGIEVG